jgi:preprotein translocase subunit SecA
MNAESSLEPSAWEKFTDGITAVSEGVVGFLGRLFGSSNERMVRSLGYIRNRDGEHTIAGNSLLDKVNSLEEAMTAMTDEELKNVTVTLRERLEAGETLDDILPEAFAACREAGRRTKNMRHFDTQIVGGIILHRGNIAEMATGEGKTLVATLPAYLNAIQKKGVHVITVNDYLARRDCEWMSPIYHALGISCGFIQSDMDPELRRRAYECDITYGTNSEFGFDYLRDNMKAAAWGDPNYAPWNQQVQRGLNFAIIDEVDNILIDEARTPLIISGPAQDDPDQYRKANKIAVQLSEMERKAQVKLKEIGHGLEIPHHPLTNRDENEEAIQDKQVTEGVKSPTTELPEGADDEIDVSKIELPKEEKKEKRLGYYFEVKEKERTCHLTDEGVRMAEKLAGVDSFYTAGNMEWPHLIDNALKAHHLYHKDKNYVVMRHPESKEMAVIIVDEFTGRLMVGRQWSDGLHQAVEAKHERDGVKIKEETQTLATITLQNYFKLYKKLAGMTGTAMTEANEFWKIYKLDTVAIPTNRPMKRLNFADLVYMTEKEKWDAIVKEIEAINKYDTVHLNDGTDVIGTIEKESDTEITVKLKDSKETQTIPVSEIDEIDRVGRPILIGTTDVDRSEKLSRLLQKRGIKHELLNAKPEYASREAEIVAQAGRIGAVTISTNMAGRGTDIILGGNPETLAWSRLKEKYPTRLDVPDTEWKQVVDEIREKEGMVEEGRQVADMGGLHVIGTERHEARRIDNQLRGRAGRQGDPGSSRFYVSLQDDLMRIFAGEWVAGVLQRMGMTEGEAIESKMVSRRIEAAQKKVEERNFDIRKNLLEYDEVMDHQRKRVYGFRQEILHGGNCKTRILDMIERQIEAALDKFMAEDYGASSFAEMASSRLNVELEPKDFLRLNYADAQVVAREKASQMVPTSVFEMLDELLDPEADEKEWNYNGLADRANNLWDLKTTAAQLRKMERDDITQMFIAAGEKMVENADLSKGEVYLDPTWGLQSLADWAKQKFGHKIDVAELVDRSRVEIRARILGEIRQQFRAKEAEFPVTIAMARYMADRGPVPMGGAKYDREGLLRWYQNRFGGTEISEETFRTESRAKLHEMLLEISRKAFPATAQEMIDTKLEETYEGATVAEEGDAQELAEWMKQNYGLEVDAEKLAGLTHDEARNVLWNAYDERYRPEMRRMERNLILDKLDRSWKNHLYLMDHLRQGIGLVGYAQIDPKTEYKRQGMKEFDSMWDGVGEKVTEAVFRLEDDESFQESVFTISAATHAAAPRALSAAEAVNAQQQAVATNAGGEGKKLEPIRNRGEKVGRNDPCPCGSGKKFKNCCMKSAARG